MTIPANKLGILEITEVKNGDRVVAIEMSNGVDAWFYELDQDAFVNMRIGRYPRKNLDDDYARRILVTCYTTGAVFPPRKLSDLEIAILQTPPPDRPGGLLRGRDTGAGWGPNGNEVKA